MLMLPAATGKFMLKEDGPYHLLDPTAYTTQLGADYSWAIGNDGGIPLFDASDSTLRDVYLFRWRTYKSHIHSTGRSDNIPSVVTEFSPDVGWAGKYNTINCAAGHHMIEAGWLRNKTTADSYSRWWVTPEARHNYYYWYATALRRNFLRTENTELLRDVVPSYKTQFLKYVTGELPGGHGTSDFSVEQDCLWNHPGNEGQEQSISGEGCRTLIQSLMYGESAALADLCMAIGDTDGAAQMMAEADKWQRRVLRLWNPQINSFDTLRMSHPNVPPPPPPPPLPDGWTLVQGHNGTFCCDQSPCVNGHSTFLYQGELPELECLAKCSADERCKYVTLSTGGYCFNAEYCNTTNPFKGEPASAVHTYQRTSTTRLKISQQTPPPVEFAGVRELASLSSPWYFSAVPKENATAYKDSWLTAFDPDGLAGQYGLRTAEKRNKGYRDGYGCCQWSGPMWPFESSKAITAAINVLNNYPGVDTMNRSGFFTMLQQYAESHTPTWKVMSSSKGFYSNLSSSDVSQWLEPGLGQFWIAEAGCPDAKLTSGLPGPAWTDNAKGGYRYNHATFMDLVLSGVVGIQPETNTTNQFVVVNPLAPATALPWWAADGIAVFSSTLTVAFDSDGKHWNNGSGLKVWVNGTLKASAPVLTRLIVPL